MKKKTTNRDYFTQETEDAILLYNKTESPNQRSKIYSKHIHYPFFKLTQNIIHTFKFYNTEVEDLEHLQHEIIVFLLGKMYLYHHSKSINDRLHKIINKKYEYSDLYIQDSFLTHTNNSDKITLQQIKDSIQPFESQVNKECWDELKKLTPPKAYSYFGTIVKRWLINYNNKNYEKKVNSSPLDNLAQSLDYSYGLHSREPSQDQFSDFLDDFIDYININLYNFFPKNNDAKVADAILELFRKREAIEIFNKKALYIYIREQGDFKTQKITKISNTLSDIFKEKYTFYLENGYVDFEEV